jgi:hypothetical protein
LTLLNLNETPTNAPNPITNPTAGKAGSSVPTAGTPAAGPPVWKVLVLDQRTQDVLATILRVQDLRDVGVTLHVCVHSATRFNATYPAGCGIGS